jgi:hypothetical protein
MALNSSFEIIRGMASYTANMNRTKNNNRLNIEGTEGMRHPIFYFILLFLCIGIVPYKGDVKGVLDEIEDGTLISR